MGNPILKKMSPRGHQGYELISAMQKFIRRAKEKEALYCFYELESMGAYHIAKNRLMITVYEDCGIENPELLNSIPMHISQMDTFRKNDNGAWRLILGNIVLQACRGFKTRIADHFVSSVAFEMVNGLKYDFMQDKYNFIFDKHTLQGKRMGRGNEHFFQEAVKLDLSNVDTDYRIEELENIDKAYEKGNPWVLYKLDLDDENNLFSEGQ